MDTYRISKLSEVTPDQALSLFQEFYALKGEASIAFFRSSVSEGEGFQPTLSILGVHPSTTLQSKNGKIRIQTRGETREIKGNPFHVFSKLLKEKNPAPVTDMPFFQGGALGYFGYDSVRFIEPILQKTKNLRMKTDRFDAEIVFFKNYVVFDHESNAVSLICEDEESEREFKTLLGGVLPCLKDEAVISPQMEVQAIPLSAFKTSFGKAAFLNGVRTLKSHIQDGDIFQAVLSEQFRHGYSGSALYLFKALLEVNPAPYQFFFSIDGRSFMGASPEMLLKAQGERIETHPIAGTRPRGKTPEEEIKNESELKNDVKENAEHLMLVDLSRNDIGRVSAPGSVKVESFQKIRKFGGVMHLVSKVTGTLQAKTDALSAFASCFPAGTLSGAPKIRAMELLSELEPEPRGFYGGAFIAASVTGDLDSCISIRSMSLENRLVTLQAGAGIVADSSPEKEYEEIEHKSRLARTALALALKKSAPGGAR